MCKMSTKTEIKQIHFTHLVKISHLAKPEIPFQYDGKDAKMWLDFVFFLERKKPVTILNNI